MLRIALNGRFSGTAKPTGTQIASFQLFDAIVHAASRDAELVIFADRSFEGIRKWESVPNTRLIETPFSHWSRGKAHFWEQLRFPALARQHGCRVAHHPMTTCPSWQNGLRTVVTLHDLNFHRHPEWYSRSFRLVYALCAVPGLRCAARVVTISRYVEQQARGCLGLRQLATIHNGVKPLTPSKSPDGSRYILCVGSLQPHKNLVRTIHAFRQLRTSQPDLSLHVVGRPQPRFTDDPDLPALLSSDGVTLLGYLSEEELANQYAGAAVFCYPSLEEGFGMPLLEAMGLGTPVVTSNASCLPEIGGDAAIYVDPQSVESIRDGLARALSMTAAEREEFRTRGLARASQFSWAEAAQGYLRVYRELAE